MSNPKKNVYGKDLSKTVRFRCSPEEKEQYNEIAKKLNTDFSRVARLAMEYISQSLKSERVELSLLCVTCNHCNVVVEISYDIPAHVIHEGVCWNCKKEYYDNYEDELTEQRAGTPTRRMNSTKFIKKSGRNSTIHNNKD